MSSELFEKGLKIRREVLGDEYVNNSLKNADEFSMPLQEHHRILLGSRLGPRNAQ